ncbi:LytR/AlgR family response regulator transcription factor [Ruminococcus flavefaciens]|uniref:Stage 0 sporulation protein A homolog n=1 Tax=Ruminococcus flavefaciens 007c TaxID=1341157 RepID=W7UDT8_RUMFL|nr:response regulator [Ruminococcus flavefaciens]EWM53306.1 hypothetical protein RF007C_10060 [Ruminococcus flavefaciens 007c]
MKILAIDDERFALQMLVETISKIKPEAEIVAFRRASQFLEYEDKSSFDAAFLDIRIGKMSGIQVAIELKKHSPQCNIVFVTSYSEYAFAAIQMRPSGYIMKPYTEEDIRNEFENFRYVPQPEKKGGNKLKVRTFGNFRVFGSEDIPMKFSRTISKEIFAYLIDQCGYPVTSREIAADVLEVEEFDRPTSKKVSQYVSDLIKDLELAGYNNVIIKQNRQIQINKEAVDCDLYDLFAGDTAALNSYHGEYMIDYSWAEISDSADRIKSL